MLSLKYQIRFFLFCKTDILKMKKYISVTGPRGKYALCVESIHVSWASIF